MHAYAALGMLALAGSVLAAPFPQDVVYETAVVTIIVGPDGQPIGQGQPAPTPAPEPQPAPAPAPAPAPTTDAPPAPAPTDNSSSGGSGNYMDIVNKWRAQLGLANLNHDDTLEANALKTCTDDNGTMNHELNPGSFAQVLAEADQDPFEKAFVGGWLCEKPDMPGMNGICDTMSQGRSYSGSTGHADILTNPGYSKIGCAWVAGVWGCDLA